MLSRSRFLVQRSFTASSCRRFSSDSHDDFKSKLNNTGKEGVSDVQKLIQNHVSSHAILLYMKGTPQAPQCGFSQQVVRILHAQGASFDSINVLEHPEVREGIKVFSSWPTVPQLYVGGEFVGGCDILTDMHQSGELEKTLKAVEDK